MFLAKILMEKNGEVICSFPIFQNGSLEIFALWPLKEWLCKRVCEFKEALGLRRRYVVKAGGDVAWPIGNAS